jgi:hypothetical protein
MCVFRYSNNYDEFEFIVISTLRVCTSSLVLLHVPGSNPQRYLHLSNCSRHLSRVRLLAVQLRPIQSKRGLFQHNKKTRAFEWSCSLSQEGAISPIFEGDTPPKK